MKTAISIPDRLFAHAEQVARRMKLSRSQLYVTALRGFLDKHRHSQITQKLDAIYETQPSSLEPAVHKAQALSLPKGTW